MEKRTRQLNKLLRHYQPGALVFKEGDLSNELYILKTGTVAVIKRNQKIAEIKESGSYVGEMSALLGEPRSATLKAETFCQFYVIPGDRLFKLILDNPTIGMKLLGIVADRLRDTSSALVRKEKEVELHKRRFEKLENHYMGIVHLYKAANKVLGSRLLESISEYAERVHKLGTVNLSCFDKRLITNDLKKLLKQHKM